MIDAHEIVPNLWQGSCPYTGDVVRDAGFDVLVLCAIEYQLPASSFPGVKVIHVPFNDHDGMNKKDRSMIDRAVEKIVERLSSNQRVLITCMAGINRSSFVTCKVLNAWKGYSGRACIALVRKKRKLNTCIALTNRTFVNEIEMLPGTEILDQGIRSCPGCSSLDGEHDFGPTCTLMSEE